MSFYKINTFDYSPEQVECEDQASDNEYDYVQPTLQGFVENYESESESSDGEDLDAHCSLNNSENSPNPSSSSRISRSSTFTTTSELNISNSQLFYGKENCYCWNSSPQCLEYFLLVKNVFLYLIHREVVITH